tara:strand:+ start:35694 stop:36728 length:1035 start_codon:yes stop_codon:yes gene_type:complete
MKRFNLNQNQFSDIINLTNNVFFPLTNFVNKSQFENIVQKMKLGNKFFPYPVFFGINKNKFNKYKNEQKLILFYKLNPIVEINDIIFFDYDKKKFGKTIYGKNFKKHPYYKKFNQENYKFLHFNFYKIHKINFYSKFFVSPKNFLKKTKTRLLPAFHTRNVPHAAHQRIHKILIKRFNSLLIQPLIGQYKPGEYKDKVIINLNKIAAKSYKNKNIFVIPFFSYPRYGGPREAALHAIVRKNYGCSHFWVGRDHAGYKNFFKKYESQNFCKKIQKKLKIKIVGEKEYYYCSNNSTIVNNCKCKHNCKISISGTNVRQKVIANKNIPQIFMSELISRYLKKNSLIS